LHQGIDIASILFDRVGAIDGSANAYCMQFGYFSLLFRRQRQLLISTTAVITGAKRLSEYSAAIHGAAGAPSTHRERRGLPVCAGTDARKMAHSSQAVKRHHHR
jgi:hypothetical protein